MYNDIGSHRFGHSSAILLLVFGINTMTNHDLSVMRMLYNPPRCINCARRG